jgi:hypothetical protein
MSTFSTPQAVSKNLNQAGQAVLDLQTKAAKWQMDQIRFAQTQAEVTARQGLKAVEAATAMARDNQKALVNAFKPNEA